MDQVEDQPLLPHEDESGAETSAPDSRPHGDRWASWHAAAARPAREGGCWLTTLDTLRWSRYAAVVCGGGLLVTLALRPLVPPNRGATEDGLLFVFAFTGLIALATEVLAVPLARLERAYARDRLADAIGAVAGRSLDGATLVGLVHDGRPEWPPGSFADSYAFLEVNRDRLTLWRLAGELTIPRSAVLAVEPAEYMARRGHDVVGAEATAPLVRYVSSEASARKVLALEALAGPAAEDVLRASRDLHATLASWFGGDSGTGEDA